MKTTIDIRSTVVYCLGGVLADTVFQIDRLPTRPTKVFAKRSFDTVGGIAGNAARAISQLGGKARLLGAIGSDAAASTVLTLLASEGVDATNVKRCKGDTARAAIALTQDAERAILVSSPMTLQLSPADLAHIDFASGNALLADWRWREAAEYAMRTFKDAGKPAVLDADIGETPVSERLLDAATHVIFSREGLMQLSGEADLARGLRLAASRTTAMVGATDGARGCCLYDRTGGFVDSIPALPVAAVDTLGAGDVFHGAFTLALGAGMSARRAAAYANAVASSKVAGLGLSTLISHEQALAHADGIPDVVSIR